MIIKIHNSTVTIHQSECRQCPKAFPLSSLSATPESQRYHAQRFLKGVQDIEQKLNAILSEFLPASNSKK